MKIKIATRGSRIALAQTEIVKSLLKKNGYETEIVTVSTKGDRDRKSPLDSIGGNGLFVREIEKYLIDGRADVAVHSGKDLPYELESGLVIAATPEAASCCDALIVNKNIKSREEIKTIGTGSPRRIEECSKFFPGAEYKSIRGNVDTRLKKLDVGEYDAIILAAAGLERLNADLSGFKVKYFSPREFIPSACQGIIAAECRKNDGKIISALDKINDPYTKKRFDAQRYMLSLLKADCSAPLGVNCEIEGNEYMIWAMYNNKKAVKKGNDYKKLCKEIKSVLLP